MLRAAAVMVLLLLAACSTASPKASSPPPKVLQLTAGMTRISAYRTLGIQEHVRPAPGVLDARLEDRQKIELPEGRLDLFFMMKIRSKKTIDDLLAGKVAIVPSGSDTLVRLQFTDRHGGLMWIGPQPLESSSPAKH